MRALSVLNQKIKAAIMGILALSAGLIYIVWGLSDILSVMGGPSELLIIVPAIVIIIFFVVIGVLVVVSIVLKRRNIPKLDIKEKNLFNVEEQLLAYLEKNKGKAFSARALHKRCIEENNLDINNYFTIAPNIFKF